MNLPVWEQGAVRAGGQGNAHQFLLSIVVHTAVGHLGQEQAANQQLRGKTKEENSLQELQYNDIGLCSPRIGIFQ